MTATPEALEVIECLKEKHGQLAFHQSGGCCDGSVAMCLTRGELLPSANDVKLGAIAGSPFYVDEELYERWRRPRLVIDVGEGEGSGFSLEGSEGVHFVSRARDVPAPAPDR